MLNVEVVPKRLQLLNELVPAATVMALLVNPSNPNAANQSRDLQAAARTLGLQLHILHASSERDFDTVFAKLHELRAGGLMSYGASIPDAYRLIGDYAARILKGANPGDLPVQQPTTFDLVLNVKTAKALGLQIPATLLARADEVIE